MLRNSWSNCADTSGNLKTTLCSSSWSRVISAKRVRAVKRIQVSIVASWKLKLTKKLRRDTQAVCVGDIFPTPTSEHVGGRIRVATVIFTQNPVWMRSPWKRGGQQRKERVAAQATCRRDASKVCRTQSSHIKLLTAHLHILTTSAHFNHCWVYLLTQDGGVYINQGNKLVGLNT